MNEALRYAILARDSYSLPPDIGCEQSASRACVTVMDGELIVSIPGTNNLACFLADLDCEVRAIAGLGCCHWGFYSAFSDIEEQLMQLSPAVIAAHSLGAAMGIIYAAKLCLAGRPPKAVYAFEPPRVSIDPTIANLFAKHGVKMHLTRFGEDIVPCIPRLLHSWQHPCDPNAIGVAREPIWNVHDHSIDNVVAYYSA